MDCPPARGTLKLVGPVKSRSTWGRFHGVHVDCLGVASAKANAGTGSGEEGGADGEIWRKRRGKSVQEEER